MKTIIKKIKHHHIKQVAIYGIVGVVALVVQTVLYMVLCRLHMYPLYAIIIGCSAGMVVGYIGHTRYTFTRTHKFSHKEFIKYVATALFSLAFNSSSVYILVAVLKYHSDIGIIPMIIAPALTFLISKFWVFK